MASPLSRDEYTDAAWIKDAMFMSARGSLKGNTSLRGAKFSDAALNFADTSPGGNPAINPPPQWNHVCDPPVDSLLVATSDEVKNLGTMSLGMGTHYAEAIQPYTRKIYLQMGVKAFNSMGNFFTMFYDSGQGVLANTGEDRGILAKFGKIAGYITLWAAVPYLAAGKMLYDVAFKALASARNRPLSKFYYMKPTMTLYWTAVSTMYNAIAVNMGYGPETIMIDKGAEERPAFKAMERGDIEAYRKLLPDVMGGAEGGIDVKAVATRYQRLANKHASIFKKFACFIKG